MYKISDHALVIRAAHREVDATFYMVTPCAFTEVDDAFQDCCYVATFRRGSIRVAVHVHIDMWRGDTSVMREACKRWLSVYWGIRYGY